MEKVDFTTLFSRAIKLSRGLSLQPSMLEHLAKLSDGSDELGTEPKSGKTTARAIYYIVTGILLPLTPGEANRQERKSVHQRAVNLLDKDYLNHAV